VYEKYKADLSWWKKLLLRPLKTDIENLISGKASDFPSTFDEVKEFKRWGKVVKFLTPKITQELFDFIKEWREEIAKRQTEAELVELQKKVINSSTKADLDALLKGIVGGSTGEKADDVPPSGETSQDSEGEH
jgi:hypothetical protein